MEKKDTPMSGTDESVTSYASCAGGDLHGYLQQTIQNFLCYQDNLDERDLNAACTLLQEAAISLRKPVNDNVRFYYDEKPPAQEFTERSETEETAARLNNVAVRGTQSGCFHDGEDGRPSL
ncbi:MAG: hypothetical protein Q9170_005897 [Blastenia crenularia]